MNRNVVGLSLVLTIAALAGCNTVSGVGKDVQAGGKAITRGAETVEKKISN